MILLFVYLILALALSSLCSIMESVLLSVPIPYLTAKAEAGNKSAVRMLRMKEDIDKPISAILTLNTISHTIGAAGVGAQATIVFGEAYFGIVSAILTLLILIISEIIPKVLATTHNKKLVGFSAVTIQIMIIITYPLVIISGYITRLLSGKGKENTTSREEIAVLANIGTQEGIFKENENKIIQNIIKLDQLKVTQIMTPRTVVVAADEEMILRDFLRDKDFLHFSRIPVYEKSREEITGYVLRSLVFEKLAEDQFGLHLKDIKREIVYLTESSTLLHAWQMLLDKKEHIAAVIDEYGGMTGIVTMEDIIETLLGLEITDEKDIVTDMQQYALDRWKERQKKYDYLNQ